VRPVPLPSRTRRVGVLTAGLLAVVPAAVVAVASPAQAAPAQASTTAVKLAQADQTALAKAKATGQPVEVTERASATQKWLAQPTGAMRLEESATPSRARQADGSWADLDDSLRVVGNQIKPKVGAVDVSFSNGGTGAFATMHTDGGTLALTWPGQLPKPTLNGDSATYAEVLPGVDLVVRAADEGFSHVLVVKNKTAAQNPALKSIKLGLNGTDLLTRTTADGGLEFGSATGKVAINGGSALMWDSRANADATSAGDSTRTATATTAVDGGSLVFTPDQSLLNAADAKYPVYIDPSYSKTDKSWSYSNSKNENNNNEVRVGLRPDTSAIYRSYFTYDTSSLIGKRIFHAEWDSTIIHSWSCGNTPYSLYQVAPPAAGKLTWSGPALGTKMGEASGHAHKPSLAAKTPGATPDKDDQDAVALSGCSGDPQPDMPTEIQGVMTTTVQSALAAGTTSMAFVITALSNGSGEGTGERWKKFRQSDSKLIVDYNSAPTAPTSVSTDGRGCVTGDARPILSTDTPTLRTIVSDPDPDTDLQAYFEWQVQDPANPGTWNPVSSGQMNNLRSGDTGSVKLASGQLSQGNVYRWRTHTIDPWTYQTTSGTDTSPDSNWCEFGVDTVGPAVAPGVSSPTYGTDPNTVYGAVGKTAPFTFTASGVADVVGYQYGWSDPPTTTVSVAAGASTTILLTPPPPKPADPTVGGLTRLYVTSVDQAGHVSPLTQYSFSLGSATGPNGQWNLADAAGSTAFANAVSGGPAATTLGGPTLGVAGRQQNGPGQAAPTAVTFDGVDDYAKTSTSPLDTTTSFTVSVWARSNLVPGSESGKWRSVVSAPTASADAFLLGQRDGYWAFDTPYNNSSGTLTDVTTWSTAPVQQGAWTQLTGVYDAAAQKVYFYVNGILQNTNPQPSTYAATSVEIARDVWGGDQNHDNPFLGDVANARVWNRVLSAGEISPQPTDLVARWALDGVGTDATPFKRALTLTSTVGWVDERNGAPLDAFLGNGKDAAGTTAGAVLRTDQSFTVAAWTRVDSATAAGTVLDQAGTATSAFSLRYDGLLGRDRHGRAVGAPGGRVRRGRGEAQPVRERRAAGHAGRGQAVRLLGRVRHRPSALRHDRVLHRRDRRRAGVLRRHAAAGDRQAGGAVSAPRNTA
jgi:hypothetical protein